MAKPLPNYLRTYRKRTRFSQDELAFLLGVQSGAKVSRYESFARRPNFETSLACEVLLGAPARRLFAGVYHEIEGQAIGRARALAARLRAVKPDRGTQRKLDALSAIMSGWGANIVPRTCERNRRPAEGAFQTGEEEARVRRTDGARFRTGGSWALT